MVFVGLIKFSVVCQPFGQAFQSGFRLRQSFGATSGSFMPRQPAQEIGEFLAFALTGYGAASGVGQFNPRICIVSTIARTMARVSSPSGVLPRVASQCFCASAILKWRQPALIIGSLSAVSFCKKNT